MSSSHSAITDQYYSGMLTIVGVEEHGVEGELGSDSLAHVEEVEHLFNRLVSLLSHTSITRNKGKSLGEWGVVPTCGQGGCRR